MGADPRRPGEGEIRRWHVTGIDPHKRAQVLNPPLKRSLSPWPHVASRSPLLVEVGVVLSPRLQNGISEGRFLRTTRIESNHIDRAGAEGIVGGIENRA